MTVTVDEAMEQLILAMNTVDEYKKAHDAYLEAYKKMAMAEQLLKLKQKEADEASDVNKEDKLQQLDAAKRDVVEKCQQKDAAYDDAEKKRKQRDDAVELGMAMKDAALRK